jgi:Phage integrase, N-terminal SAM-like domain
VDDRRNHTNATVDQLLDRFLNVLKIEDTTRAGYERLIRLHIRPVLGALPIGRINGETVDAFHARLPSGQVALDRGSTRSLRHRAPTAPVPDPQPPTSAQAATLAARRGRTRTGHVRLARDDDRRAAPYPAP